jgi:hypothetical protein
VESKELEAVQTDKRDFSKSKTTSESSLDIEGPPEKKIKIDSPLSESSKQEGEGKQDEIFQDWSVPASVDDDKIPTHAEIPPPKTLRTIIDKPTTFEIGELCLMWHPIEERNFLVQILTTTPELSGQYWRAETISKSIHTTKKNKKKKQKGKKNVKKGDTIEIPLEERVFKPVWWDYNPKLHPNSPREFIGIHGKKGYGPYVVTLIAEDIVAKGFRVQPPHYYFDTSSVAWLTLNHINLD